MPLLDVNGPTDTQINRAKAGNECLNKKNYVALNGNSYKSEAEYVKIERKGE